MRKHRARFAVLVVLLAAGIAGAAEDWGRVFTKGPYLQSPGEDTMTIMWESPVEAKAVVRYGKGRRLDRQLEVAPSFTVPRQDAKAPDSSLPADRAYHFYEATLTGLKPGVRYQYSVELAGAATPARTFRTFDRGARRTTFIAYGDSRSNPDLHDRVTAGFLEHKPDFILHNGDIVARGHLYELWKREFFDPLNGVLGSVPFCPALGNHETASDAKTSAPKGGNYYLHFHLPGNEVFYSLDQGPVHVLVLDYRYPEATHAQYAFAEKDLMESTAAWKIVQLHVPMFNVGGHTSTWGLDTYLPLFRRAKVDLVIAGHSHLYERFRPVAPVEGADRWPITYITSGGGGASLYPSYEHPGLAATSMTNHYVVFEATRSRLRGKALTPDEKTLDQFTLTKRNGEYGKKYLSQAVAEEGLRLGFAFKDPLTVRLDDAPATDRAAAAVFDFSQYVRDGRLVEPESKKTILDFSRFAGAGQPLGIEIELTAPSGACYTIENAPVRLTLPAPAGEEAKARVLVRARGTKPIAVSRGRMAPRLVFQAKLRSPWGSGLAIGGECGVRVK